MSQLVQTVAERLMTIPEVANVLAMTPEGVRGLIHSHRLAAIRVGVRRLRVHPAELASFLEREHVRPN